MEMHWRLRMVAAEHGVWSAAQLQRLLLQRAGLRLSSAAVKALLTGQPRELKLTTLEGLCTALDCSPNDLLVLTPGGHPVTAAPPLADRRIS